MKIAVLISGGVDSSVALALLKEQGYDVHAFYLKIWLEDELAYLGDCPWQDDLKYVEQVCEQFDVPLQVIPLQKEYWDRVVSYTIAEVKAGRTPSPDLLCNQQIKFGAFLEKIDTSYDKVATGHYAQVEEIDTTFVLKKAQDAFKDQTYFLSRLSQKQLSRILFPIGHLPKKEVRKKAEALNLPNKARKDSQGICFLGKIKFSDFIKHHLGIKKGPLVEVETNEQVGEHEGFWYYTIGQRKGIGLSGGPWYVVDKDPEQNIVYISNKYFDPDKKRNNCGVAEFNWIAGVAPEAGAFQVKVRHGEQMHDAKLEYLDEQKVSGHVTLATDDQGLSPGQFVVFYDGDVCLGSGVIA